MKDVLEQFKDTYEEGEAQANELIESTVRKVLEIYEDTYSRIFTRLAAVRRKGDFMTSAGQRAFTRAAADEFARFQEKIGKTLGKSIDRAANFGAGNAANHLNFALESSNAVNVQSIDKQAQRAFEDAMGYAIAQINRMRFSLKQMLVEDAISVFRRSTLDGVSRKKAFEAIKDSIVDREPKFRFVDKAGRRWDARVYFEMLARTVMSNVLRDSYIDQLVNAGHDLAIISYAGSKDACKFWEGKVVSLTGATRGYTTMAAAVASGQVFHPRCRHRLIAYHQDIATALEAK